MYRYILKYSVEVFERYIMCHDSVGLILKLGVSLKIQWSAIEWTRGQFP